MLKNILSLLLSKFYSKKENEAVGHQAMPSGISTTLLLNATVNDWGTVSSGVAATDGYLVLTARNAGNEGASLSLNVEGVARQSLTYPFVGAGGNVFVPIGKGDSWALIGSSSDSITLKLFKTVGGGVQILRKLILQGGGLCLSHWYSSLRRSSWLARRSGLLNKAYHPLRRKLPSVSVVNPLEEIGLLSPRPTTVSFALWPKQTRSLSKTMLGRGRDNRGHKDTQEPMLCVPRVALSRINWDLQRLLHLLFVSLLIPTAPLDSAVGGASC